MEPGDVILRLEAQAAAIAAIVRTTPAELVQWRPGDDAWSTLEVVCHLYDEEREDFRARVDLTLHRPGEEVPGIDPEGWVRAHAYASRDLASMLAAFLAERERSLAWLRGLNSPDWEQPLSHPALAQYGLRAGDILVAWVAHDLLHLRQLIELRYQHLAANAGGYDLRYAGEW